MGKTPAEDVQISFSGQVDGHRYEEGSDKQAENQTEFPEETNLLLLVVLCSMLDIHDKLVCARRCL
jgi:hypothetical protein